MQADLLSLMAAFKARPVPTPADLRAHCLWPRGLNSFWASRATSPQARRQIRGCNAPCAHTLPSQGQRPRRTQKTEPCYCCCFCPLPQAASPPPHPPTTPPGDSQPAGCCFSDSRIQGGSGGTVNGPQVHVPSKAPDAHKRVDHAWESRASTCKCLLSSS